MRESGYNLLGALVRCVESEDVLLVHGETFAKHLSLGLTDLLVHSVFGHVVIAKIPLQVILSRVDFLK